MPILELPAETALFEGKIQALVALCYENERPLQGLAGLLDWRFGGQISQYLKSGAITGQQGECVYFPVTRAGKTYHLILAGAGTAPEPGTRNQVPPKTLKIIQKNLSGLRLKGVGISKSDCGVANDDFFQRNFSTQFKGESLWVVL